MKIILIFTLLALFSPLFTNAQDIYMEKSNVYIDGRRASYGQVIQYLQPGSEAFDLARSAKSNSSFAQVLGLAGGCLIGWQLGTALAGGEASWGAAGVGAGILLIAFPIDSTAKNKMTSAVELYNSTEAGGSTAYFKPKLHISNTKNGLGLCLKF